MGLPASASAVRRAENVSGPGKFRALADLALPGRLSEEDVAVGPFLRRRFGAEWTSRMVDPILAGTRSGDIERMSLRYALPQVFEGARQHGSVIRALSQGAGGAPPRFKTPAAGMAAFVSKIAAAASVDIRTSTAVTALKRSSGTWTVSMEGAGDETFDAVVVALPFHQAARVLSAAGRELDAAVAELRSMPHASVASVALAYRPEDLTPPPRSSGFLVPSASQRTLAAGTWWSAKWPHTKKDNVVVVRCFVGRSGRHPALDLDDAELARRAAAEINELTGSGAPMNSRVDRWDEGLPQFEVGHHQRLEAVSGGLARVQGLGLAGPDLSGSGIPECIVRAQGAADDTLRYLDAPDGAEMGRR